MFNPVAGLTQADIARETIEGFCTDLGWAYEIYETSPEDNLRQVVRDALKKEFDLIIAAGGDGTVSGVVSGMVKSGKPMGILPVGTGNALARDLGIPLNLVDALAVLNSEYCVQPLDVMEINREDYFVLNVSVGISSLTMHNTAREEKRRFGMLAYFWRALGSIAAVDLHHFKARVDGKDYRFSASEVMVTNSRFFGLQPQLDGVEIDPNDGRLDLFVVRAGNARDYLRVFARFVIPRQPNEDDKLTYLPIRKRLRLESEVTLPVQADGEEIGTTPLDLRLIPGVLLMITPGKAEGK